MDALRVRAGGLLAAVLCAALGPRPQPLGSSTLRFPESLSPIQGPGLVPAPTDVRSEARELAVLGHQVDAELSRSRNSLDPAAGGGAVGVGRGLLRGRSPWDAVCV